MYCTLLCMLFLSNSENHCWHKNNEKYIISITNEWSEDFESDTLHGINTYGLSTKDCSIPKEENERMFSVLSDIQ